VGGWVTAAATGAGAGVGAKSRGQLLTVFFMTSEDLECYIWVEICHDLGVLGFGSRMLLEGVMYRFGCFWYDIFHMDFRLLILILLCIQSVANTTTFAFGSCNQFFPTHSTAIYQQIALEEPSHFVFLGDMLYIDRLVFPSVPLTWKPFTD
jgi:hypothetical protein